MTPSESMPPIPASRETAESFGLEWTAHGTLARLYASETDLWSEFETFRIPSGMLEGRRVLDAGCGMGRWSYVVAKSGARYVVGFDLHDGVHAARALTRETCRVSLLKANVFALPFRPASFDSIISIGVLHHTGDTIGAIRGLLPLLRPGGHLFIHLYATRGATRDRRMTTLLSLTNRMTGTAVRTGHFTRRRNSSGSSTSSDWSRSRSRIQSIGGW
jgi:2-polyprenyl-3-methyl-5-hydroxy-6-metoxy-1,4-benzoquinol methylase